MHWFKILLLVIIGWGIIANLVDVKRQEPKAPSPTASALAASIEVFLLMGVLLWV